MKEIISNYKTSLCGVVLIGIGIISLQLGKMSAPEASALVMAGAGFLTAKDS